ncbi:hypothetical protein [Pseudomonas sp.]|uniref:hypothetical protein n=1 Tax=Pseudomonas sp. TaxID=306 RepID=UPI0028AE64DE|nr:hypothetical protein [Pseudomonas sp.]
MNENEVSQRRMARWCEVFETSIQSQAMLMEVLDDQLMVEFQALMGAAITPVQLACLRAAVLNRADETWRAEVAAEQHEEAEILIESAHSRLFSAYEDYLLRHWRRRPADLVNVAAYDPRIAKLLEAHLQQLRELLSASLPVEKLRLGILELQAKWRKQSPLTVL